jgi:transcriptional regulator with XRE-family HTH domain
MKPVASKRALLRFRQVREAAGFSQIGLSRELKRSTAYVAHIENGRLNPSPAERSKLAQLLGESPDVLFADFRTPQEQVRAEQGARIVHEYDLGMPDADIAPLVGLSTSAVRTRRLLSGRASRPNLVTFRPAPGELTAKSAATKYGLDLHRLCDAIDVGLVPGSVHEVAGSHPVRTVVEASLAEYLANRPICALEGCEKRATLASDACDGPHARALETRGPWWSTPEGLSFVQEYAAGLIRATCWLCGSEKEGLAPAHLAKAWREERRRMVCRTCGPLWIAALIGARSRASVARTDMEAVEAVLAVARTFEKTLRQQQQPRRGQPRHIAIDMLIEALLVGRDLSHGEVARLLTRAVNKGTLENPVSGAVVGRDYVKTRQRRAGVKRRLRSAA